MQQRQQQQQQQHRPPPPGFGSSSTSSKAAPGTTGGPQQSAAPANAPDDASKGLPAGSQHQQHVPQGSKQMPWMRPRPGLLPLLPVELKWLQPHPEVGLLWNSTMADDSSQLKVVQDLISRALSAPLLPAQQQAVLTQLEADPKLVHYIGLSPEQLPALVEHTPMLAYELLLRLLRSKHIHAYFQVLAQMELSLHSMEVVNRLTAAAELPTEFVHLYISNCINSCEGIQDKYLQNRLVRLVCVFLQSLIRNRIINIAALLHEVQAFCINFSRVREAATLFRVLKQMELGGNGNGGSIGTGPGSSTGSASPGRGDSNSSMG